MIYRITDNIISPLGETTEQNYQAVKAGRSALRHYSGTFPNLLQPRCLRKRKTRLWPSKDSQGLSRWPLPQPEKPSRLRR